MTQTSKSIQKVLIANRGEIAVRIIKACHELGISTVAVYSDADRNSVHVDLADEAVHIGQAQAADSYLNMDKVINAAIQTGATAIHPGYGFFSENDQFAKHCNQAGMIFIGPPELALQKMGLKTTARDIVTGLGLPVIPGYDGDDRSNKALSQAAIDIGFPVLVKAAAGGGGMGQKLIERESDLANGIAAAKQEALNAFGDDELFVEKYLNPIRHIEFQVLGDQYGHIIHCGERECSIQRRQQKVVEEAPSPFMTDELRQQMGIAAVAIAKAVNYVGPGTVEFVVDDQRNFYFLEMNTRLQVEHAITEAITGLDLVQWQIRLAEGKPLTLNQEDIKSQGHAIECRLYAEDPANNFSPQSGSLQHWQMPEATLARTDTGVKTGSEISIYYDPLLAKIITHGADRAESIQKITKALDQTMALGLTTNKDFLKQVIKHKAFLETNTPTDFIGSILNTDQHSESLVSGELNALLCATSLWCWWERTARGQSPGYTNSNGTHPTRYPETLNIDSVDYQISCQQKDTNSFNFDIQKKDTALVTQDFEVSNIRYSGAHYEANSISQFTLLSKNLQQTFTITCNRTSEEDTLFINNSLGDYSMQRRSRFKNSQRSDGGGSYESVMPCNIVEVLVAEGETVTKGQKLIITESMKMENSIAAASDGIVKNIFVTAGGLVEKGFTLIEIQEAASTGQEQGS